MEYNKLIQLTLTNSELAKAAQDMSDVSGALNLVDLDWENKLKEYDVHQRHLEHKVLYSKGKYCRDNKVYVRNIVKPSDVYKIIVLGAMYYDKPEDGKPSSIIARDCLPLGEIGKAMQENPQHNLHDGARLFFDICDPSICVICQEAHKAQNVPIDHKRNWCVTKLRVYDGLNLKHTFKMHLEDVMQRIQFLAICQVSIRSRSTFGDDKYKIGGNISNIIVFQQSVIQPRQDMTFMIRDTPSIEYPEEENADDEGVETIE